MEKESSIRRYNHLDDLSKCNNDNRSGFLISSPKSLKRSKTTKSKSSSSKSSYNSVRRTRSLKDSVLPSVNASTETKASRPEERNHSEPLIDVSAYNGWSKKKPTVTFKDLKTMNEKELNQSDDESNGGGKSPVPTTTTTTSTDSSFNSASLKKNFNNQLDKIKNLGNVKNNSSQNKDKTNGYVSFKDADGDWRTYNLHKHHFKTESFDLTCKVMLLGDSGVGKTCLLTKFKDNTFLSGTFISTVGIDYRNKVVDVDDTKVKLQIWDTAGQERFRSVTHAYYRDAHALLLLYDVSNKTSFDNTRAWLAEVHEYAQDDVVIMLIANKSDVDERKIRKEDGQRLAREYNVAFMETSAKSGLNVDLAFTAVARELRARKSRNPADKKFNVADYVQQEAKSDSCIC